MLLAQRLLDPAQVLGTLRTLRFLLMTALAMLGNPQRPPDRLHCLWSITSVTAERRRYHPMHARTCLVARP